MSVIEIPGASELVASATTRRSMLRTVAGVGLAIPAMGALRSRTARAQDMDMSGTPGSTLTSATPIPGTVEPYNIRTPFIAAVEPGTKDFRITAMDKTLYVAKDVAYASWTFDGTVPGSFLRARQGDTVNLTFAVDASASTAHSLDTHAAKTPMDKNMASIMPGEELTWSFVPKYPGAFMYHCGTAPVLMHIGTGMYGAMIIDPAEGWSPAQELVLVQSEFYLKDSDVQGVKQADYTKMMGNGNMDYVVFNGYANQYVDAPIIVKAGELIRIFVVNCGPNVWSSFHIVGTIFDQVFVNANPANKLVGLQSISIGPGDGACVEFTLDEPGTYAAVNHAFGHAAHGAIAHLKAV